MFRPRGEAHGDFASACRLCPYSREVPQQGGTQVDLGALSGTVTCGYTLWWTGCHWMACKRSGVRIPIAPLRRHFSRSEPSRVIRSGLLAGTYGAVHSVTFRYNGW
jgi:hypothetical protein